MHRRSVIRKQKAQSAPNRRHANSLLTALPHAEYQRLLAAGLEPVTLKFGEVLHEPGVPIRYVYFPIDSVVSLLMTVTGHHALKVGLVGYEGIVGIPLALGIHTSYRRASVQRAGTAMRMESALFRKEILHGKALQQILFRFKHALVGQIAQTAVCKQFHSVQARVVSYLLMTRDRARSNEFRLTQAFLAGMLGVRRSSVTLAASILQKRALIKQSRGEITILDQKGLSAASCECYRIIKRIYASVHTDGQVGATTRRRRPRHADRAIE